VTAQRLGAVEHDQDRPGHLQPALAEPNQHLGDHGGVLGGALGQSQGTLVPSRVIPTRPRRCGRPPRSHPPAAPPTPGRRGRRRATRPRRARSGPRTDPRPPTWRSPPPCPRHRCPPVPARPGTGGTTAWPASAPPPTGRAARWRRTPARSARPARRDHQRSGPGAGGSAPGGRPGSPGRAQRRGGPPPGRGCGGPWADQPVDLPGEHGLQHLQAGAHRQANRPSRAAPASWVTATVTCPGSSSWAWSVGAVRWVSFGAAVPFWSSGLADARHLPHGRSPAGTATSTSTGTGTTSRPKARASVTLGLLAATCPRRRAAAAEGQLGLGMRPMLLSGQARCCRACQHAAGAPPARRGVRSVPTTRWHRAV
jgi:hypothetical protein